MASTAHTAEPEAPTPEPAPNRFFEWLRSLDLPRQEGWIGGVCAGIAARLRIDPLIVRGVFVVVALFGGPALLAYAAAWLLLPDANNKIHLEEVFRGRFESAIAGIAVLVALAFIPFGGAGWFGFPWSWGGFDVGNAVGGTIWTVLLLASVIWFIVWIARRSQQPSPTDEALPGEPPAPPAGAPAEDVKAWRAQQAAFKAEHNRYRNEAAAAAAAAAHKRAHAANAAAREEYLATRALSKPNTLFTLSIVGVSLIAGALTALAVSGGDPTILDLVPALSVSLAVLAVGIIINGVRGKRSGGASPIAVFVVIALIAASAVPRIPQLTVAGDLDLRPSERALSGQPYFVIDGDVDVNLTDVFDGVAEDGDYYSQPEFKVYVASGDVTVTIPGDEYVMVSVETNGDNTVSMPRGDASTESSGYLGLNPGGFDRQAFSERYSIHQDTDWAETTRSIYVRVWVGSGDVTIIRSAPFANEPMEAK
jgi:phage shock protein PspC (stress-responsive transcriptional regulator)